MNTGTPHNKIFGEATGTFPSKVTDRHKRFEEKFPNFATWFDTTDGTKIAKGVVDFIDQECSLSAKEAVEAKLQVIKKFVETMEVPEVNTNFNDGGDDEYRSRRIAVDSARSNGYRKALSDLTTFLTKESE